MKESMTDENTESEKRYKSMMEQLDNEYQKSKPNKQYDELSNQIINNFINNYKAAESIYSKDTKSENNKNSKKLIHATAYGKYREYLCKKLLNYLLPRKFGIGSGFLLSQAKTSYECDLIIHNSMYTPMLDRSEPNIFYPIETCLAVGEVKSTISKKELFEALKKLSTVKEMRNNIDKAEIFDDPHDYNPKYNPDKTLNHQIVTFLICKKINYAASKLVDDISDFYMEKKIAPSLRHNLILSLEDGVFLYRYPKTIGTTYYPYCEIGACANQHAVCESEFDFHGRYFFFYLYRALSSVVTLFPNIFTHLDFSLDGTHESKLKFNFEDEYRGNYFR